MFQINPITGSPWTTGIGIITMLPVLINAWQTKTIDWGTLQQILVGLGFIAAKDWNVTGGSRDQ